METSTDIKEIAIALVKVQSALNRAKKDSENPHFKSKYADLTAVWDACHAALQGADVAVIQGPGVDDNGNAFVETMLLHKSGQFIKSRAIAKPVRLDPQAIGSATTYLRRYGLAAMVGVVQEDDDGNGGSDTSKKPLDDQTKQTTKPLTKATRGVEAIKQIDPVASGDTAESLAGELALIQNKAALVAWFKKNEAIINGLPESLKVGIRAEYGNKLGQFKLVEGKSKAA